MSKKILSIIVVLLAFSIVNVSCKKDDDNNPGTSKERKVKFKAFTSDNAKISIAIHTNAQGDNQTNTNINAKTWESAEITIPASVPAINFGANGSTNTLGDNGKLTVQIIIDGKVVKENVSNGDVLSASAIVY
ncbi:hypothetical protein [Solitalea canadensis]|uniref:BACON domain-containing protein n=1 Tax=Solitalea canadensis (strain ATCC 29591 / DSM 3403 / JCM 21819 / LMG 8368 / NBRC 15130 / NCIMB 12057 / USAM 9D) TaxID=929556 RepID=H8KVR6_SOLCM|nr:hypothetical protein [Solitalea canadensis]AFD06689.1 hypothetical protein Solca_1622 [Solitalea canadensis DSM 3403]